MPVKAVNVQREDLLMTLPQRWFPRYLKTVYERMAVHVPPGSSVVEVGARPGDRGVISREVIPHEIFGCVDRDPVRAAAVGGLCLDVLETPIMADVIISTCVLHHTRAAQVPLVLANLRAPLLMFSGPSADTHEPYGDHLWHLDPVKLADWLEDLGYEVHWERVGLTEPFCELLVVARRTA